MKLFDKLAMQETEANTKSTPIINGIRSAYKAGYIRGAMKNGQIGWEITPAGRAALAQGGE